MLPGTARPQLTNSWITTVSHFWDVPSDWSLGLAPSNNQAAILITNTITGASNKTINLDSTTPSGTMTISNLSLSAPAGLTNTLSMNSVGGAKPLRILNAFTISAGGGLSVSNSTLLVQGVSGGSLLVNGRVNLVGNGVLTALTGLRMGNFGCTATGVVVVAGGSLFVTNASGTAVLEVRSGMLLLKGGTVVADRLVTTNSCAVLEQTGGTLIVGGITNPFFRVTAINREGNNMRVAWQTFGGVTNILQAANGGSSGSYNTNFVDLPPQIIVTGIGLTKTNSLDVNGATNKPARFYRVRLAP